MAGFEEIDALVARYSPQEAEGLLPWKPHYYQRWLIVKGLAKDDTVVLPAVVVEETPDPPKPRHRKHT